MNICMHCSHEQALLSRNPFSRHNAVGPGEAAFTAAAEETRLQVTLLLSPHESTHALAIVGSLPPTHKSTHTHLHSRSLHSTIISTSTNNTISVTRTLAVIALILRPILTLKMYAHSNAAYIRASDKINARTRMRKRTTRKTHMRKAMFRWQHHAFSH